MYTILIVDNDRDLRGSLRAQLTSIAQEIYETDDGYEALDIIRDKQPDIVLLDVMMPVLNGYDCAREIRQFSDVPIIFLSARAGDLDRIHGLSLGADDYLAKPFHPSELKLRIQKLLARHRATQASAPVSQTEEIACGELVLDQRLRQLRIGARQIKLTPTEYKILAYLMRHSETIHTAQEIYAAVWKSKPYGAEGTVAVHIHHLRQKIEENPEDPQYIQMVWGHGYRFDSAPKTQSKD